MTPISKLPTLIFHSLGIRLLSNLSKVNAAISVSPPCHNDQGQAKIDKTARQALAEGAASPKDHEFLSGFYMPEKPGDPGYDHFMKRAEEVCAFEERWKAAVKAGATRFK